MKKLLVTTLLSAATSAQADFAVLKLGTDPINTNLPTHVFFSGYQVKPTGKDNVGNLFFESAYASGLLARENLGAQVVFIVPIDVANGKEHPFPLSRLKSLGLSGPRLLQLIVRRPGELTSHAALNEVLNFRRIAGLHFFGHSSLFGGATLAYGHRVNAFDPSIRKLLDKISDRMEPRAFMTLNGCNSGYKQAPQWSAIMRVPVRGTLTGTDFQELHSDGNWYFHNPGQFPTTGEWAAENSVTYTPPIGRWAGGQVRMMPTNSLYHGSWGDFEGGLGFPKFFCNYDRAARHARPCEETMPMAAAIFPGHGGFDVLLDRDVYRQRILDILCPTDIKGVKGPACRKALVDAETSGNRVYTSFAGWPKWGHPLQCDFTGCDVYASCDDAQCVVNAKNVTKPTTQIDEYLAYMRGFRAPPRALPVED